MIANVDTLTREIDNEVIRAMGVPIDSWLADRLHGLLMRATRRFSELFAQVDRIVGEQGLPAGALFLLHRLAKGCEVSGVENVPQDGPLIIASNHPGTVDSLAVTASAQRNDLKIIASASPFLQNLPSIRQHLIFAPKPSHLQARMVAMREGIRHLKSGGSILLFAHGDIDPDPGFMPVSNEDLNGWSRSLEIFLRTVPETSVVISIVSRVIDPSCMRHPITWLRHARTDRQRLAMMIQIIQQMLGKQFEITPHVSFGELMDAARIGAPDSALQVITGQAQLLMQSHLTWPPTNPTSASFPISQP
jgi:hypothetical protein